MGKQPPSSFFRHSSGRYGPGRVPGLFLPPESENLCTLTTEHEGRKKACGLRAGSWGNKRAGDHMCKWRLGHASVWDKGFTPHRGVWIRGRANSIRPYPERQATKSIRRMPRRQKPKKDVVGCDKPRGAVSRRYIRGFPNGVTHVGLSLRTCALNP